MDTETENFLALVFSKDKENIKLAEALAQGNEKLQTILEKIKKAHAFFFQEGDFVTQIQKDTLELFKWEYFDGLQKEVDEYLPELKNLESLRIRKSALYHLPERIGNLNKLKFLRANCYFLKELPESLFELQNLEYFGLDKNLFQEINPKISKLTNLKTLNLKRNQLTTLPSAIKKLQKLSLLNIDRNPISKAERDKIKSWLPKCQVIFKNE